MRLVHHESEHLGFLLCLIAFLFKEPCKKVPELDWKPGALFQSRRVKIRTVQYQFAYPLRMRKRKQKRNVAPVRKAEQMSLFYLSFDHKSIKIVGKPRKAELPVATRTLTVSTCVDGNYPIFFREESYLIFKVCVILPVSVQKDQRKSVSLFFAIQHVSHLRTDNYIR